MRSVLLLALVSLTSSAPLALHEEHRDGVYTVDGSFELEGTESPDVAWGVLTDYDHLGAFLSSIRESRVESRRPGGLVLEQVVAGRVMFVTRTLHLLLDVTEGPGHQLAFRDTSHRDFEQYEGSYSLILLPHTVRVAYHLRAQPRLDMPGVVGRAVFESNATDLLNELRTEITRRAESPGHGT
jgi:hypothetical protein